MIKQIYEFHIHGTNTKKDQENTEVIAKGSCNIFSPEEQESLL